MAAPAAEAFRLLNRLGSLSTRWSVPSWRLTSRNVCCTSASALPSCSEAAFRLASVWRASCTTGPTPSASGRVARSTLSAARPILSSCGVNALSVLVRLVGQQPDQADGADHVVGGRLEVLQGGGHGPAVGPG